jgi:hypothetical protein
MAYHLIVGNEGIEPLRQPPHFNDSPTDLQSVMWNIPHNNNTSLLYSLLPSPLEPPGPIVHLSLHQSHLAIRSLSASTSRPLAIDRRGDPLFHTLYATAKEWR